MTTDARSRPDLFRLLEPTLGTEATLAMIDALPPYDWPDLATKDDLARLDERFTTRLDHLDGRFSERLDHLDGQFSERLERMDERFVLRHESLSSELTATFRKELNDAITAQTRTIVFGMLGLVVSMGSFMLATMLAFR